jgi:hypothetical protein
MIRAMGLAGRAAVALTLLAGTAWAALAIYYCAPGPRALRGALALGVLVASAALALAVRRRRLGVLAAACLIAGVAAWWLAIPPAADRDWQPDVARLPWAEIRDDTIAVHNVRNNEYRSEREYSIRYEDRHFALSDLRTLDLFLCYWGSPAIAHTIASFGFADGQQLAISIETRKEQGEEYSAVKGFFKQYELIFVVADERDVVRLRTNHRGEDVYLYRLRTRPEVARALLLSYLREVNRLRERPEWYNALTHNCTTAIRGLAPPGTVARWPHWKVLLNGHLDELMYERGALDRSLPFAELRAQSRVSDRAQAADQAPDFSRRIREGLPGIARLAAAPAPSRIPPPCPSRGIDPWSNGQAHRGGTTLRRLVSGPRRRLALGLAKQEAHNKGKEVQLEGKEDTGMSPKSSTLWSWLPGAGLALVIAGTPAMAQAPATQAPPAPAPPAKAAAEKMAGDKPGVVIGEAVKMTATVDAVDKEKRTVTLKGPQGRTVTVKVAPEAKNFDQIKVGDKVRAEYVDALAIFVRKSSAPPAAGETQAVGVAPRGKKPAAVVVDTTELTAKVKAIDYDKRTVTLEGPEGKTKTIKVDPRVKRLREVKVGDELVIRHTEAVAIALNQA